MFKRFLIDKPENQTDVIPLFVGKEDCAPHHAFGPYIREHYLLHFCLSGKGVLHDKSGTHAVGAGQFFIIRTGEVTRYEADGKDPWEYAWLAFRGKITARFDPLPSVCQTPDGIAERLLYLFHKEETSPDPYTALLYELAYGLSLSHEATDTLSRIHRYVRYHYMEDITVESISATFGFERSHLFRIFKKRYGTGLKEFIIEVRMRHAKNFLHDGLSVGETARLVGYADEFNFSRAYKKHYIKSPKEDKSK
jgi:AraC-like DNA-binding protein